MSKKVFVTRKIPESGMRMLRDKGYAVDVYQKDRAIRAGKLKRVLKKGEYDAVLCLLTDPITFEIFDAAPTVKIFANYASGFDNIDIAEAKKRGIVVTNAPSALAAQAVAQHTIALMLALSNRVVEADAFARGGKYKGWSPLNFVGTDLYGKTLGLVGVGRIGERTAMYAKALGLSIIYTDIVRNEHIEKEYGAVYAAAVEDLLPKADVVSLHVPLLDSTRHLINEARLRLMKPTAFLINTARGPVVDEVALEKALRGNVIAGAALDVFEHEPKVSRGLAKLSNVVLTPHIASASIEARSQMAELAAQNIIDHFEGKVPANIVNQ